MRFLEAVIYYVLFLEKKDGLGDALLRWLAWIRVESRPQRLSQMSKLPEDQIYGV